MALTCRLGAASTSWATLMESPTRSSADGESMASPHSGAVFPLARGKPGQRAQTSLNSEAARDTSVRKDPGFGPTSLLDATSLSRDLVNREQRMGGSIQHASRLWIWLDCRRMGLLPVPSKGLATCLETWMLFAWIT